MQGKKFGCDAWFTGEKVFAVVWKDGRLLELLAPGRHAFWKTAGNKLAIEIYSIVENVRFTHPRIQAVLGASDATKFFDGVMVMTEDAKLRDNRLALLAQLRGLFLRVADLSRLPG